MKNEDIIQNLTREVHDKKEFILELLITWQNEIDVALLDSVYLIARKNMNDLVENNLKRQI